MGKWFGQASEIEELRTENRRMELLATGPKIAAVKAYKDRTGVSLKAAKAAIDAVPVPTSSIVSTGLELTHAERQMVADGRPVSAIKAYRDRTGVDLRTAKAAIDAAR